MKVYLHMLHWAVQQPPIRKYVNKCIRNICSVNRYDVISGVERNGEGDDHDHDVGDGDYDAAPTE